jgi:uncharacterized protein (TIGR02266 family)
MDKRVVPRKYKRLQVKIISPSRTFDAFTGNLSKSGIFVRTNRTLGPGSIVKLNLSLPSDKTLKMRGRVQWEKNIPSPGFKSGMGISLLDIPPEYIEFIETLFEGTDDKRTEKLINKPNFIIKRLSINEIHVFTRENLITTDRYKIELGSRGNEHIQPTVEVVGSTLKGVQKGKNNIPIYEASLKFINLDDNEQNFIKKLIYELINRAKSMKKTS